MTITVACASDIHGMWGIRPTENCPARWVSDVVYPSADFLILAGDILSNYSTARGDPIEVQMQLQELERLNAFYGDLKQRGIYKEVILVSGNHDWVFQKAAREARAKLTNVVYLQDESIILHGRDGSKWKFYGSPWQPHFWAWAWNFPDHNENFARARAHAKACWAAIPHDTQILITHGPAHGILDETMRGEKVGCQFLLERLKALKHLRLHVFGHIHHSRGTTGTFDRLSVNAALCNEGYKPVLPIQVVSLDTPAVSAAPTA